MADTTWETLLWTWERLRALNTGGYHTSESEPISTWLIGIQWQDSDSVRRPFPGRGTSCSPFTTQSCVMAFSPEGQQRVDISDANYRDVVFHPPFPILFCRAANGNMNASD